MYKIKISKKVDKFLEKHLDIAKKFIFTIEKLEKNPFSNSFDIKILKGQKNTYKLRIGKYRFLYKIIDKKILIYFYEADSRGNIYK